MNLWAIISTIFVSIWMSILAILGCKTSTNHSEEMHYVTQTKTVKIQCSGPLFLIKQLINQLPTQLRILDTDAWIGPSPVLIIVGEMHSHAFRHNCKELNQIAQQFDVVRRLHKYRYWATDYHGIEGGPRGGLWFWKAVTFVIYQHCALGASNKSLFFCCLYIVVSTHQGNDVFFYTSK